jgi:hypothetical protein
MTTVLVFRQRTSAQVAVRRHMVLVLVVLRGMRGVRGMQSTWVLMPIVSHGLQSLDVLVLLRYPRLALGIPGHVVVLVVLSRNGIARILLSDLCRREQPLPTEDLRLLPILCSQVEGIELVLGLLVLLMLLRVLLLLMLLRWLHAIAIIIWIAGAAVHRHRVGSVGKGEGSGVGAGIYQLGASTITDSDGELVWRGLELGWWPDRGHVAGTGRGGLSMELDICTACLALDALG